MFESLITNIRRKLTKPSPETADNCETVEKTGLKKRLHLFKLKLTKQDVKNPPIDQCDDIALSPRANGVAGCAQTEIEWPKITDNNPNLLDKFTRIVTITDYAPYHDKKKRNDREEIRRRLAMGADADEYFSMGHTERPGKKPSLQSRLQSGAKLRPSALQKNNKSRSSHSLGHIELKESDFYALQATLQTEARIALAQAKEMARIQMEHERRSRPVSPVTEMLRRSMEKANAPLASDRRRVSRQLLTDMNIAQLQVIVNELHSQIESLNDSLVKLLMARDELHMGQDSMLVDIEDLTRYLGVKEQTKKTKGSKSGMKRLTSLVK